MSNNTLNTVSNPSATNTTDLVILLEDLMAKNPRVTLPDFAAIAGVSTDKARSGLIDHYGTMVEFRRGRKGGIYIKKDTNNEQQ
jgi:hypothetical protein